MMATYFIIFLTDKVVRLSYEADKPLKDNDSAKGSTNSDDGSGFHN